jgi:hypothetical protein
MVEFNIHRKPEQQRELVSILNWAGQHWLKLVLLFFALHLLTRKDTTSGIGQHHAESASHEFIAGKGGRSIGKQHAEFSIGNVGKGTMMVEDRPGILPGRD